MDGHPSAPRDSANLIAQYRRLHAESEIPKVEDRKTHFPGRSMMPFLGDIKLMIISYGSRSILDYGCGQGWVYDRLRVQDWWRVKPTLYDPAVPRFAARPVGLFDGVICCDVMEHLAEADVPHYLAELRDLTNPKGWCFISVCCRAASRILPDGRNAHITIRPEAWWIEATRAVFCSGPRLDLRFTA